MNTAGRRQELGQEMDFARPGSVGIQVLEICVSLSGGNWRFGKRRHDFGRHCGSWGSVRSEEGLCSNLMFANLFWHKKKGLN